MLTSTGVRRLLDVLERCLDLVRLYVRAGDHGDAEEHRRGGQRGAQLALRHAPQREGDHRASSRR